MLRSYWEIGFLLVQVDVSPRWTSAPFMVATNPFAFGLRIAATFGTHWLRSLAVSSWIRRMTPWVPPRRQDTAKKDADTQYHALERPWITLKMPSKSWDCLVARYHLDNFLESAARCLSGRSSAFISRACLLGKPPMPGRMAHLNGHRRLYGPCQCHRSKAGKVIRLVERLTDAKVI